MDKIINNINKCKYILGTIVFLIAYICFFQEQLSDVLSKELNTYIVNNNMSILIGLYGISFGVVSVVTILTNKGNYILWVDIVDYQLIDNKIITLKDLYFLLVVTLCVNTISCFKERITDCLIGYAINIILLFLIIYVVIEIFYTRNKIIKKLERIYRKKDTKDKLEIINKLYFITCGYIEERNLSKINESLAFIEKILLKDYKILDFCEKYFIKIYIPIRKCFGKSGAEKVQSVYIKYRQKLWDSTDIGDDFFRKIMRELLKKDITLTSICGIQHEEMYKVSSIRNEIYLKLHKYFAKEEKLNRDEKILLCRMYLGKAGADNIVNLMINKRGITCILYDSFFKLLLLGLQYEDYDVLKVVDNSMRELEETILKKYILNISYNTTREYYIQWEKFGKRTLFGNFYEDLDTAYQKINDLIEIQKKIVVDSIYGNDLLECIKSIKRQLYTMIIGGIFVVECTGENTEFNIHVHDVSHMHFKAFVINGYAYNDSYAKKMGVHLEKNKERNIISVKQNSMINKYYLVFFREYDWVNREYGIPYSITANRWKIPQNRFQKKDYEFTESQSSELKKLRRM